MRIVLSCLLFTIIDVIVATSTKRQPIHYASIVRDATFRSRDETLKHDSHLELFFNTDHGPVRLDLKPNLDLLLHGKTSKFVIEDDFGDTTYEDIDGAKYNVYKGHTIRTDDEASTRIGDARIFVHSQSPLTFEGTFTVGHQVFNVQPGQTYSFLKGSDDHHPEMLADNSMVMWSDADMEYKTAKRGLDMLWYSDHDTDLCPTNEFDYNINHNDELEILKRQLSGDTGNSYVSRAKLASTIGQTAGCPAQREVAVLGAAADCNFVAAFNDTAAARASIIAAFNSASGVYESSFNISLGLGQIVISEAACPSTALSSSPWNTACDATTTLDDRLNLFSSWRGSQTDSFAAWSLLTTCATNTEVGVAWLGTLCNANTTNQTNSVVSGTNVVTASSSAGSYWRTLAHEIGHNFGASHDCTSSLCSTTSPCCPFSTSTCSANGAYLMNPALSSSNSFSPCTVGQVCSNILNKVITTSCLSTNQNVRLADGAASCGNGIVEEGEDCDCGGTAGCGNNPCCNPTTCKFNAGAVCDSEISACCTSSCQFAAANTTCRASTGACDPAETCTGTSGLCPSDAFAPNGQNCGSGLQCASGQCTSRTLQCQQQINGSSGPCDDYQCSLTCLINNQCFVANQYFATGTSCGNGGFCQTGICDEGSFGDQVSTWFDRNRNWLIPVIAVVGGLIVLLVLYCWIASCLDKRKKNKPMPQTVYTPQTYFQPQEQHQMWPTQYQHNAWQPQQYPQYSAPQYPQRTHL